MIELQSGPVSREEYLQRAQYAFHLASRSIEEIKNRRALNPRRLFENYREGRLWLTCEMDVSVAGEVDRRCFLARLSAEKAILDYAAAGYGERHGYPRHLVRGDQEPVLVDVAELVQDPKGMSLPALVCLYFIDGEVDGCGDKKTSLGFAGEPRVIIGEGKGDVLWRSCDWSNNRYGDVVKGASDIADGIADHRIDRLVWLLQRVKNNFLLVPPLFRFKVQGIKVCTVKPSDPGLKISDVFAAPLKL